MRTFYISALGLAPRSDRPGFVNFELGAQRLTVAVHSEVVDRNRDPLHVMVNLETSAIWSAFQQIVDCGGRVLRSPEPESWGGMVATLADPDGNLIQLLQLPHAGNE
jgi:predicted enzyme related to lactoylglutathione lyase